MANQTQENYQTFFQCCAKPIEKIFNKYIHQVNDIELSCQFKNFYEIEMAANLLKNQDAIFKFEFIIDDKINFAYVLIQEELMARLENLLSGGDGNVIFDSNNSQLDENSIRKPVLDIVDEIMNYFSVNYQKDLVLGKEYNTYLKEMDDYESVLGNCNLTFLATAEVKLGDSKPYNFQILLNSKFLSDFMTSVGFSEKSIKKIKTTIDFQQLSDIKMDITAEFGHTQLPIKCTTELTKNSLIMLDEKNGEDIKVYANGLLFAYAQIVLVGENFGLRLTRIISSEERELEVK